MPCSRQCSCCFFFFNDTATTEIYTLSLHDALPISPGDGDRLELTFNPGVDSYEIGDRKSTRLNSSHGSISYAVFCLKKKNYTLDIVKATYVYLSRRHARPDVGAH